MHKIINQKKVRNEAIIMTERKTNMKTNVYKINETFMRVLLKLYNIKFYKK